MNKKHIIAIVLFVFISLSVYTFANPNRDEDKAPNNDKTNNPQPPADVIDDEEDTEDLTGNERENEGSLPSYISLIDMAPASINVTYISNEGKEVKYNKLDERVAIRFISSERLDTSKTIVTIASQNARLESSKTLFGNQYEYVYSIKITEETKEGVIEFYIKAVDTNDNESSVIRFTEKDYRSYKGKIIIDKTAPEIELKGEENVILEYLLDTYTEENAIVTDNIDETREIGTNSITYSFDGTTYEDVLNVDTSKIGIYKLVYTSEDKASHKTVDKNNHDNNFVQRTVVVQDTKAANVDVLEISNNGKLINFNKLGDKIFVKFQTNEELDELKTIVKIAGQNASLEDKTATTEGSLKYIYTYSIYVNEETPEGEVTFNIKAVDKSENVTDEIFFVENKYEEYNAKIKVDKTKPTVTVNINGRTLYIENGSRVNTTQKPEFRAADENLDKVKIFDSAGNVKTQVNDLTVTYRYAKFDHLGNGTYKIVSYDKAGNSSDEFIVIIDNVKPILDEVKLTSNSENGHVKEGKTITLSFKGNETLKNAPVVEILGRTFDTLNDEYKYNETTGIYNVTFVVTSGMTNGNVTFTINYKDLADNDGLTITSTTDSSSVLVDTVKPEVKVNINGRTLYIENGSRVNSTQKPEFRAADENLDKVKIFDSAGNVKAQVNDLTVAYRYAKFDHLGNGTYKIVSYDKAGNSSDEFTVTMDNVKPILDEVKLTSENNNGYVKAGEKITLSLKGNETLKNAPVVEILGRTFDTLNDEYKYNETTGIYNLTFVVTEGMSNGNVAFTINYKDLASNEGDAVTSTTDSSNVNVDTIAPIITIGNYSATPTKGSITVTATTNEGTLNTGSHKFEENGSFTFTATDLAGNVSSETITITNIDKTDAISSISYTNEDKIIFHQDYESDANKKGSSLEKIKFTFNYSDADSGLNLVKYKNGERNVDYFTSNGSDEIDLTANPNSFTFNKQQDSYTLYTEDKAGNKSVVTKKVDNIFKGKETATVGNLKITVSGKYVEWFVNYRDITVETLDGTPIIGYGHDSGKNQYKTDVNIIDSNYGNKKTWKLGRNENQYHTVHIKDSNGRIYKVWIEIDGII